MTEPKLSPAQLLAKQLSGGEAEETKLTTEVKVLREKIGLSQSDVARSVGCSTATIGSVEKGNLPRLDVALKLSAFFEKTLEELWSLPVAEKPTGGVAVEKPAGPAQK